MLTLEMAPAFFLEAKQWLTLDKVNDLILVHYPLAVGMARKFARKREVDPDDYVGEAGLATTKAIHNAFKYLVDAEGITKYVTTYIRTRLMKFYQERMIVRTPARRQQEFFALGYLTPIECRPVQEDDLLRVWDSRIMEDLYDVCPDEFTRKVAHLRIEAYTNNEIAVLLNRSIWDVRQATYRLRRLLKEVIT